MILKTLDVCDFRNIAKISAAFDGGANVVCGMNAEGKTNLLESIWLLTGAKSFRGSRDSELIKRGCAVSSVDGSFFLEKRIQQIRLTISEAGREISLNKAPLKRASSFAGTFCCVCFSPNDMAIVAGAPSERRRFLDTALCQLYPSYLRALKNLTRLTAQKNALLKSSRSVSAALELVESYDGELAAATAEVTRSRISYLSLLSEKASEYYYLLSGESEQVSLEYTSSIFGGEISEAAALSAIKKARPADMAAGFCTTGAHRDDIDIKICGVSGRSFGSQGQKRSAVLAMKLAETDVFKKITGERPVLLLDDVLSELDEQRQTSLIQCISGEQAVITGCDETAIRSRIDAKIMHIKGGALT